MKKPASGLFGPVSALAALTALLVLAGCASPSPAVPEAVAPPPARAPLAPAGGAAGGATAAGTSSSGVSTVDLATARSGTAGAGAAGTAMMAAPAQRIIYFDFDSFAIKDEFKSLLDAHAKVMVRSSAKRMVVEGHADERGGREYNLALGQRRAEAVTKSLALLGVPERQLEAVSFGKERPAVTGSDEAAWARNRRAELKDL